MTATNGAQPDAGFQHGPQLELDNWPQLEATARVAEFFQTPTDTIDALLLGDGPDLPGGIWLDPCAGLGRIPRAVSAHRPDIRWQICELLPAFRPALEELPVPLVSGQPIVTEDFLAAPSPARAAWRAADVVIFNSPFSLTLRFIERAWRSGRWVISLQRQSWIGPTRARWLRAHMPDRYGLPRRPSFRADRKTDGCEYEWHVWPPDARDRRDGITRILLPGRQQLELL